jgi:hypothetical protein
MSAFLGAGEGAARDVVVGGHAQVDGGCAACDEPVDLGEFGVGGGEADLESFGFSGPALVLGEAKQQGWLGEVTAIETTLAAADQKLQAMRGAATHATTVSLGMPEIRRSVGRSTRSEARRADSPPLT